MLLLLLLLLFTGATRSLESQGTESNKTMRWGRHLNPPRTKLVARYISFRGTTTIRSVSIAFASHRSKLLVSRPVVV